MPVTVKVNGSSNSLVHKGSNGISMATIPDVCKTPSPGGPVPIPYPNISQSITLDKGTSTVKADGMMIAIKGSEFSLSNGDNAGVAGGVKSSTFMKESTWILYSFDVKMDGANACRLTDKKFQNHENTVDLGGCTQLPVIAGDTPTQLVASAIHSCDKAPYEKGKHDDQGQHCRSLSTSKHSCVMHVLREEDKSGNMTQDSKFTGVEAPVRGAYGDLVPDTIIKVKGGHKCIDAKFPCKTPFDHKKPLNGPYPSDLSVTGESMKGEKELDDYLDIKVDDKKVKGCDAMTPKDAATKINKKKCTCK
jgi:uncharacterized Zn-binding protein involved in type VI secretion